MNPVEKLLKIAEGELGYLEKKSNKDLDSKTANAGMNNYTKYARDIYPSLQAQPWCDMFVDWCFVQAFGEVLAKKLICGGFSAYTPTSAQYFKNKGQYYKADPKPGDQVFFKNSTRIYHTGIVEKVESGKVYTIEGNTSGASGVVENGGGVFRKSYSLNDAKIDGYGRPDWTLVQSPKYDIGWNRDEKGWWYSMDGDTYLKDCWKNINGHRYYFKPSGYAATDWREIDGKWYYFEPRSGHPLECALYVSDKTGAQVIGEFSA